MNKGKEKKERTRAKNSTKYYNDLIACLSLAPPTLYAMPL